MTAARFLALFAAVMPGSCAHSMPDDRGSVVAPPIVAVDSGKLRGVARGSLRVFRGIPYAAPPVDELRWKAPQQPAGWTGLRDASDFGPGCIQPPVPPTSIYYDPPAETSEDCLTINVWAPRDADGAPVIVWLHGGSLRIGSSSLSLYDGSRYAERGAVFVSANYRLGPLGWLAHEELSGESAEGISGNYGLLDQIAALRWVRDNVAAFGGDPDNVTVMGESAGALSVTYLMASPLARGLFDRAIIQSTNLRTFPELDRSGHGLPSAETIGATTLAGIGAGSIAEARAMNAQALTDAATANGFPAQGTIDGTILPRQLVETFDRGEQAAVPVIVGYNAHEVRSQRALLPAMPENAGAYEDAIGRAYGDLAPEYLRLYPASDGEDALVDAASHGIYGWSGERIARSQHRRGLASYLFVFDHCYRAAKARGLCGFHAGELPFSFGNLDASLLPANWPVPDRARAGELSGSMLDYWVSFAANGRPVSGGAAAWLPYGGQENYLRLADQPRAGRNPYPGMFELHERFNMRRRNAGLPWGLAIGLAADPAPPAADEER